MMKKKIERYVLKQRRECERDLRHRAHDFEWALDLMCKAYCSNKCIGRLQVLNGVLTVVFDG